MRVDCITKKTIVEIGHVGEKGYIDIAFDVSEWVSRYPSGNIYLAVLRYKDEVPYPVRLDIQGNTAVWHVTDVDTAINGKGKAQLNLKVGDEVTRKSDAFLVVNKFALDDVGAVPDPYDDWFNRLTSIAELVHTDYEAVQGIKAEMEQELDQIEERTDAEVVKYLNEHKDEIVTEADKEEIADITKDKLQPELNEIHASIEQIQSDKMEFYEVRFAGDRIVKDGVTQTYAMLKAVFDNPKYWLYLHDVGVNYLPLGASDSTEFIQFNAQFDVSNNVRYRSISIDGNDAVTFTFKDFEMTNNKAVSVNNRNRESETVYPSMKAMTGYTASKTEMDALSQELENTKSLVSESIVEIKEDINSVRDTILYTDESTQLYDRDKCAVGYLDADGRIYTGGSYDGYRYTDYIDVSSNAGRTVYFGENQSQTVTGAVVPQVSRIVVAYDSNKIAVKSLGANNALNYTIPDGISYIRLTFYGDARWRQAEYDKLSARLVEYYNPITKIKSALINPQKNFKTRYDSIPAWVKTDMGVDIPNKKGDVLSFYGEFDSFVSCRFGIGYNTFYGGWLLITATEILLEVNTGTEIARTSHGLQIADFIAVTISRKTDGSAANITLTTASGSFTVNWFFTATKGDIFVLCGNVARNVKLSYAIKDLTRDLFLSGDSYTSLGDASRYPKYLLERGYSDMLMIGYGGINSKNMLPIFERVMSMSTPKYVLWALGMNDASDTTTYPDDWKTAIDRVIELCASYGAEPIFATIPCVPNIDHTKKNEWVRLSGYRYVDFAKAVGAEQTGSTWRDGMLSADNVHPSELGAKALAARFMLDVNEAYRG